MNFPKESQDIEKVLQLLSKYYYECNKVVYPSEDVCYSLALALLFINTSLHNSKLSSRSIQRENFVSMVSKEHP
jgi:Sec7-like guanine-nucleotide exchange factor